MSESQDDATPDRSARDATGQGAGAAHESPRAAKEADTDRRRSDALRLSRRGWTVVLSGVLVLTFVLLGTLVRVPYVVLGPGPTYDTLGKVKGSQVIQVDGRDTYPTSGALRMTTVSFNDEVTLFEALGMWLSGRYALAPREAYFKEGQSEQEFQRQSERLFQRSQSNAELAAFHQLGFPTKVIISDTVQGTPAAGAGKDAFTAGKQLVAVDGEPVSTVQEVQRVLGGTEPGQTVSVTVASTDKSGGSDGAGTKKPRELSIELGKHPKQGRSAGFIGLKLEERAAVPFDVQVSLDEVGGPSAGMIFALGIVDRLTPGSLTGGNAVAGTGTIEPTGQVGAIGGISFKLVAAHESGAEAFLVPARNCATAAEAAPDGLRLIKVGTLDDAVTALKDLAAGRPTPSC